MKTKKIAQCRYCTNSSNEGNGHWLNSEKFICGPCANKVLEAIEKEKETNRMKGFENEMQKAVKKLKKYGW